MKKTVRLLMSLIFLPGLVSYTVAQEKNGTACFAETETPVKIYLPPVTKEKEYVDKMTGLLNDKFKQWVSRIKNRNKLNSDDIKLLEKIKISVNQGHNTIGNCQGTQIFIDEGNLLVAYDMCYASAMLMQHKISINKFNIWHDYLFDAIVEDDPIPYVSGVTDFDNFIFSNGGLNDQLQDEFVGQLNSWIGLILLHEASHILLHHADQWSQHFPHLDYNHKNTWTAENFAFSRKLELQADSKALDLYMNGAGYDPGPVLSSYVEWWLIRKIYINQKGLITFPTHPEMTERLKSLFTSYFNIVGGSAHETIDQINKFTNAYENKMAAGHLREVPVLDGNRPAGITANMERFMIRDTQLTQLP
jgi:hypothetical protein